MDDFEHVSPFIGSWYKDVTGSVFEVVAIDEDDHTVEIQYVDGSLEEIDLDMWWETPMEIVEAPEDWTGSLDLDRFDLGELPSDDWNTALDFIDRAE